MAMLHHGKKIQSEKLSKAIKKREVINFIFIKLKCKIKN